MDAPGGGRGGWIDEIGRRAGINRATFYDDFEDKSDIAERALRRIEYIPLTLDER
jgi:AcrR family transcriptional regulator